MRFLGLIPEPPFDPRSWSGSSSHFFSALERRGILRAAIGLEVGKFAQSWHKLRELAWPVSRWRERYHASAAQFAYLTRKSAAALREYPDAEGVLQVGAWFSAPRVTKLPCFSYHDGNAALRYRHYGRGLLSDREMQKHLERERQNYRRMRGIFVMSAWLKNSFVNDFGMPPEKVHVVGAGINFHNLPEVRGDRDRVPRFLFVGRDFERKGGSYLLNAFRHVHAAFPLAELHVVGPGPRDPVPGVIYHGFLSKANPSGLAALEALFRRCSVLVLPSVYEPFGISLLEGMAFGLACIAVDRCAMPEIVVHGQTGLVARAENSESLTEAMLTLAGDPDQVHRMGSRGRTRVEQHFTWDVVASRIAAVVGA